MLRQRMVVLQNQRQLVRVEPLSPAVRVQLADRLPDVHKLRTRNVSRRQRELTTVMNDICVQNKDRYSTTDAFRQGVPNVGVLKGRELLG